MRTRILLAGLLTAGLLAGSSVADAASPTCRDAATREFESSNLDHGEATYAGTFDEATGQSSGTVTARLWLLGRVCNAIDYTLVAVYDAPPSPDLSELDAGIDTVPVVGSDPEPVELSRTSSYKRVDNDVTELRITLAVQAHPTECVHLYATTSTTKLLDRAPNDSDPTVPLFNEVCISDNGNPGSQYWN